MYVEYVYVNKSAGTMYLHDMYIHTCMWGGLNPSKFMARKVYTVYMLSYILNTEYKVHVDTCTLSSAMQ